MTVKIGDVLYFYFSGSRSRTIGRVIDPKAKDTDERRSLKDRKFAIGYEGILLSNVIEMTDRDQIEVEFKPTDWLVDHKFKELQTLKPGEKHAPIFKLESYSLGYHLMIKHVFKFTNWFLNK
jgi:hypothetical protein